MASAALVDTWQASDLDLLDDGDAVGSWTSTGNRMATASVGDEPTFRKNATPSGKSAVHFDFNRMTVPSSPAAGLAAFSLAVVFKVDLPGVDEGTGWSTKSGIVDANEAAAANDWGFSVRETGFISFGTGSTGGSDLTVYLDNQPTYPSLVDGKFHVAVCTWGAGAQTLYLDGYPAKSQTGVSTAVRNNAGFSLGAIHSGEATRQFVGDLAEVRFYDTALTSGEVATLIAQLSDRYLTNRRPLVHAFASNTNFVFAGSPVTLSWSVSDALSVSIDNGVGTFSTATGSVQVVPGFTTTYTLTATNLYGAAQAQTLVQVDPGMPTALPQSVSVIKNTPRTILLEGQDPRQAALTYALVQAPQHGALSGTPPGVTYTPSADYVGPDFFTFKVNNGTLDSAPAVVDLYVDDVARPPHGIFLSSTDINAAASPGAALGLLRAVDTNRFDAHTFSLATGSGDVHNGMFAISGDRLLAGAGFPTVPGTNLYLRVRSTDSAGLWAERVFALQAKAPERHVVVNEIHYNPAENTVREEFIELYNPSNAPVSLALWRLRGGVDFVFPAGTAIPAGGYLVVASDPATLQARFGKSALGPWAGNLSSDGERITLRDPADGVVDEVEYRSEFPWPIAANGAGASMELIHPGLDNDLGSSWASSPGPSPSPGARNGAFTETAAPNIRQVNHWPKQPASTNQVTVTAKVTDPDGVRSVILHYQAVAPGNFIPSHIPLTVAQLNANPFAEPQPNPAFEAATNWVALAMHDDGLDGDAVAGDDIYTAVAPVQPNRTLVRYRITGTDLGGASRRAPFADDPSLNFAWFVYNGVPPYSGTSAEDLQKVPVYFMITRATDFDTCTAYNGAYQLPQFSGSLANEARFVFNWPAAFVYESEVYDHVRYRLRGANGRYQNGKRNFRIRFNDGRHFAARDEFGNAYPRKWASLSTAKGQSNRQTLTLSLNEYLNFILLEKVGVPSPVSHYFHWRVVRGALEAPDLYNGDFYGLSWAQEEYDAAFLEGHNLPKGNLYKLINAVRDANPYGDMVKQRRYQGPFAVTNGADAVRIQDALLNPTAAQTDAWLQANVNYTNWYAYHTILEAVRNYDTWPSANKNAAWYFDTNYTAENEYRGRFWTLPWDWTDTWGPTWNAGQDLAWNGIWGPTASLHPNMLRDYRNTMREIRDLLFQPDQINPLIDAIAARIAPIAQADRQRWANATPAGSSYASMANPGPAYTAGLAGYVQDLKRFMFTGGSYSWWTDRQTVGAGGWITRLDAVAGDANIPSQPTLYYVGQPGFPMNSLTFECLPFADPQGAGTFGAIQWRLAETPDANRPPADPRVIPPLEWDTVWTSGPLATWTNRATIPGVYVQTNKLYRARVRHQDNTGRWSKWSAPVEFSVTGVDIAALLREGLRFSELMYNPPAMGIYSGDDLEFLELKNIGGSTLDLGGLAFSGIAFSFPQGTSLAPGQKFLLGRNAAALQAKYPGLTVHGLYGGKLDNAGETIRLSTPAGDTVLEVTYNNTPPWPVTADGLGWSLVLADPVAGTYRASTAPGGSPNADDPANNIPAVVVNEVLAHTDPPQLDTIELFNPTDNPVNIAGWYLSDDPAVPKKYRIPDVVLPRRGYATFTEAAFNLGSSGFALSSLGDDIYLFSGNAADITGYVHGGGFGASDNGVAFGRYVNSAGTEDFVALSANTLGTNNARPLVGPVVVSEIMFQPLPLGTNENFAGEFVELRNAAGTNVPLYATGFPTNTWRLRNAVDYDFPPDVVLPPGGTLVVVGFDPADAAALAKFRADYALGAEVPVFGPWTGRLDNAGESLELKYPDEPELDGTVPYVLVERISWRSQAPWPVAAGNGLSLQRGTLLSFGNDPTNWFAALPTAGRLDPRTSTDVDGDGVPDAWELTHETDAFMPDAGQDPDADGFDNLAEWTAGTDPQDAASYLKFDAIEPGPGTVVLRFHVPAHRAYRLVGAPLIVGALWQTIETVPAAGTNRLVTLRHAADQGMFYRLAVP